MMFFATSSRKMQLSRHCFSFIALCLLAQVSCSDYVLSQWSEWSQCFGECKYSVKIRNRDILVPALPENLKISVPYVIPAYPPLYETQVCRLKPCEYATTHSSLAFQITERLLDPTTMTPETLTQIEEELNNGSMDPVFIQTLLKSKNSWERKWNKNFTEQKHQKQTVRALSAPSVSRKRFLNTLTIDLQDTTLAVETTTTTTPQPIIPVQKPKAKELQVLFEEMQKRSIFARNERLINKYAAYKQKLMRLKSNKTSKTESLPTTPIAKVPIDYDPEPALLTDDSYGKQTQNTNDVATSKTWDPKSGYVPNSKKHAAEITDMLYKTREIIKQALPSGLLQPFQQNGDCTTNPRCCKIVRDECPDGMPIYHVKRYYRESGASTCQQYDYPSCGAAIEVDERPILFEQNCQDICFSEYKKTIDPLFQL